MITNKTDFLNRLQALTKCSKFDAHNIYNRFMAVLILELQKGESVHLPRVGHFEMVDMSERTLYSNFTKKTHQRAAYKRIRFKVSPQLRMNLRINTQKYLTKAIS